MKICNDGKLPSDSKRGGGGRKEEKERNIQRKTTESRKT